MTPYAELHCLTNFSFLRGASHPEELVQRAHAQGYQALAITDESSLAGVVRAQLQASELNFPIIIGSEFRLPPDLLCVIEQAGASPTCPDLNISSDSYC